MPSDQIQAIDRKDPDVVIITGLSGSGMSSAMNAFEDLGFFCVDNLPVTLLSTFARLIMRDDGGGGHIKRAALVIDIREKQFLLEFRDQLEALKQTGLNVLVLFLEASDDALARRFSETRRPHPADAGLGLQETIAAEREAMHDIRAVADHIFDTSDETVHTLRRLMLERFSPRGEGAPMRVQVVSFGHKYGGPRDLDLLFDVRHLPNPHFIAELREYSGKDRRVISYLNKQPEVDETIGRFAGLLDYLLPLYKREGKSYVTVGIGCTGGRHRSVMIADALARRLRKSGFDARSSHRDIHQVRKRSRSAARKNNS
jgi:UPF0042 nucleotide-binding protein